MSVSNVIVLLEKLSTSDTLLVDAIGTIAYSNDDNSATVLKSTFQQPRPVISEITLPQLPGA